MLRGICLVALTAFSLAVFAQDDDFATQVTQLTDEGFDSWRSSHPQSFVMFYAPWCGHCKAMKPDFAKLASTLKGDDSVAIGAVDCTAEGSKTCQDQGVQGYPTIKYFPSSTATGEDYAGERSYSSLLAFLKRKQDPDYKDPAEIEAEEFKNSVPHVEGTPEDFDDWLSQHPNALVMFFAPWCGHCKAMKPEFAATAASLPEGTNLAAVDCTAGGNEICSKYGVTGYPTIKFFSAARDEGVKYEGGRTAKAFIRYLNKQLDPNWHPEFVNEPVWEGDNGKVVHINDEHWDWFRAQNPRVFTFFYAPWCGHCKNSKPEFVEASRHFGGKNTAQFVAVDCTESQDICSRNGANSYPTIKFFSSSDDTTGIPFDDARLSQTMVNFVDRQLGKLARAEAETTHTPEEIEKLPLRVLRQLLKDRGVECTGCTEKPEFVQKVKDSIHLPKLDKKKHKMTWAEEQRMKKATEHAAAGWDNNGAVIHATEFTLEDELKKANGKSLVMFYADWCGHCKSLKPEFVAASNELKGTATLMAIECTHNPSACTKHSVGSYPTLLWFDTPTSSAQKLQGTNMKTLINAVNKALDPSWTPKVEPFKNEKLWGDDNGDVVHLTDDHFDWYMKDHNNMLVMFHAPWCGHCKAFKPKFGQASTELGDMKGKVSLVAVDCTEHSAICSRYGITGYPTIKYFSAKNPGGEDADMSRTTDGVIDFLRAKLSEPEDAPAPAKAELSAFEKAIPHVSAPTKAFRADHPRMLCLFYSKDTSNLDEAQTEFVKAKDENDGEVKFVAANCDKEPAVCKELGASDTKSAVFKLFTSQTASGKLYKGALKYYGLLTFVDLDAGKDEL